MNIFEFYTNNPSASLKTAAGYPVTITKINEKSPYPLEGWALFPNDFKYKLCWDVNGMPTSLLDEQYGMTLIKS